ncbi:MAG: tRNA (adenosine(37)-N6)-threonylcarbamoyltransferase complex ATPase subunit type 1 TsaE [Thermoleophilia bacterium]|nr:tRNA (adenosine(37)-N6)-threonylcarbamoyltransferase complex ATPase subunit type 1 TsaE [Thermoleophilia bacterium]
MSGASYLESHSADETAELARAVAALLRADDIVVLRGEIGVGKTTFVRAAARALGVVDRVTSPTFTVAQRYEGRLPVGHIDAYRLSGVDDEELGMLLEVAEGAVTFIEWPDALDGVLPEHTLAVRLDHLGGDRRRVSLRGNRPGLDLALRRIRDDARIRHRDTSA